MVEQNEYYAVKKKALPEVLLKVVEAKHLIDTRKVMTVQEAIDKVGISRSSFYKYKDDIFPFHENSIGRKLSFVIELDDELGLLSTVLGCISKYNANILTVHQSIPVNQIALLTLSIDILQTTGDVSNMIEEIENLEGIHYLKILAKE